MDDVSKHDSSSIIQILSETLEDAAQLNQKYICVQNGPKITQINEQSKLCVKVRAI